MEDIDSVLVGIRSLAEEGESRSLAAGDVESRPKVVVVLEDLPKAVEGGLAGDSSHHHHQDRSLGLGMPFCLLRGSADINAHSGCMLASVIADIIREDGA